jgi:hypothetical protein
MIELGDLPSRDATILVELLRILHHGRVYISKLPNNTNLARFRKKPILRANHPLRLIEGNLMRR